MKRYVKNYLFAEPSYIEGMARILDLASTQQVYNTSESDCEADLKALSNDWLAVGDDLRTAITKYERKTGATA